MSDGKYIYTEKRSAHDVAEKQAGTNTALHRRSV